MKKFNTAKETKTLPLDKSLEKVNYPASEDIYNQLKKEPDINPENPAKKKEVIQIDVVPTWNEKDFKQDHSGSDLDIPGSELDDEQEDLGSEDEENNGYSIGGEDHHDLEENNGQ
jgi:hypothetical protein